MMPLDSARLPPPHFAGRKAELDFLNRGLDRLIATGDPTGGITLITGVPGIGKTQLANKFAKDVVEKHKGVVACHIGSSLLESPVDLLLDMAETLNKTSTAREVAEVDSRRTGGSVGVLRMFTRSHTKEHVRHTPLLSAMLRKSRREGMWTKCAALILAIDELQTVSPDGMKTLRMLHEGDHQCPIFLLGVGLQHTPNVLAEPGGRDVISRPNEPIRLRRMSDPEAAEAIGEGLAKHEHNVPDACVWALARHAQGFPQHVHGYLSAALTAIEKHGHLEQGDALSLALKTGHRHRDAYYDMTANKMRPVRSVIFPVVDLMRRRQTASVSWDDAAQAIASSGGDGADVMRRAIAHGVLELHGTEVSFGIPSFHTYMLRSLNRSRRMDTGITPSVAVFGMSPPEAASGNSR